MNADIEALLVLQNDDDIIRSLETRFTSVAPRLLDLDRQLQVLADALTRAQSALESEERRHHELLERVAQHRLLHERNVATLDSVKKMREATAALSQVEQARRVLAEEESELHAVARRRDDQRATVATQRHALETAQSEQAILRAGIADERASVQRELDDARAKRQSAASRVGRPLLGKYDRIHTRRGDHVVFALRGHACGSCDTTVPMQRRNEMVAHGGIELCEACGVLLYAAN